MAKTNAGVKISDTIATYYYVQFTFADNNLCQGDRIYFRGFNSSSAALNGLINNPDGFIAASTTSLSVDPPASQAVEPGVPLESDTFVTDPSIKIQVNSAAYNAFFNGATPLTFSVDTYVAKRRLRIPFRFRGIERRHTNFLDANSL